MAVAYNNRLHYYFGKVIEESKGEVLQIRFLRQLSTNKYCWLNKPVVESVEVKQIVQWNIKLKFWLNLTALIFSAIEDVTTKCGQCRAGLEMAKKKAAVCTRDKVLNLLLQ